MGCFVGIFIWLGIMSILAIIFRSDKGIYGGLECFKNGHDTGDPSDVELIISKEKNKYGTYDWARCKRCKKNIPLGIYD